MGQEIPSEGFTDADRAAFRTRLREETKILKGWFDTRRFAYVDTPSIGLEIEAWLIDSDALPAPMNAPFLAAADDPLIVPELSQYNFEINTPPVTCRGDALGRLRGHLESLWARSERAAEGLGLAPLMIGILPTVRDEMLQLEWMSPLNRYYALNAELLRLRAGEELAIAINGGDELRVTHADVMLEAACTSIQVHLQTNQEDARRIYNAAIVVAAPLVAVAANAPYLFGKSLWRETRIPTFEQATACASFRTVQGPEVGRVSLGGGYLHHSILELFLENLDGHPVLLPALSDAPAGRLDHVRLQNGTIWRWVRPVIGFDGAGAPHLRIEHRVMSAGPTIEDVMANVAFCVGLVHAYARRDVPPEEEIPFEAARANFYAAAQHGLGARVQWRDGETGLQSLVLERLIPEAKDGLADLGADPADIARTLDGVMRPRALTGRTGADWQRSFVHLHGRDFQGLTERYLALQRSGRPVHEWRV